MYILYTYLYTHIFITGGVDVPFHVGADAHSDGDAMYHSIVDAILGALSLPDIGQLFPDNDPNWKGADSSIFMEEVCVCIYVYIYVCIFIYIYI
jgi:2-C-methyl-D-erythritol 2,4-cyclodiphosphate synthase